jgi:mannose-6-phosphate isomerase-like protein (cupin superfamily)
MQPPGVSHHLFNASESEDLTFIGISEDHADDEESIQNP